ncbi:hypothetical protein K488DRAFT_81233 [Vararia minispora EC-137]|uniref:Uncharacterized protein n=1 Tax=Vararia minispora EC-137 TaxID=1314806 RepID=A0ACB8Q632_9AGAM|nr:hypothetical protein K488DRAFT_81233 [Vararia minispora EC-137]
MVRKFTLDDPSAGKKYPTIDLGKIRRFEIFPPIGVARVGDSGAEDTEIEYYYGPEVPGITELPSEAFKFRDAHYRIKRQAARFRVYAYDEAGKVLGEVNNSQGFELHWRVHVANKKAASHVYSGLYRDRPTEVRNPDVDPVYTKHADDNLGLDPVFDKSLEKRTRLIIDPGEKSIFRDKSADESQPVQLDGRFKGSRDTDVLVNLGQLLTDEQGRLVFLGGSGHSDSVRLRANTSQKPEIISEFDSVDWYDDVCDGWVDVTVKHNNPLRGIIQPQKATILSAPPKFAWGIELPTTLYDILENIYENDTGYIDHKRTDFYKDIWPVLSGTYKLSWVNEKASQGHGFQTYGNYYGREQELSSNTSDSAALRQYIFSRLREPNFKNPGQAHTIFMPRLSGDNGIHLTPDEPDSGALTRFAALTELQYERFRAWKDGDFDKGTPFDKKAIEDYEVSEQPVMLTRAALETTVGDPLYPGIEMFWIAKLAETYRLEPEKGRGPTLRPPFRVDHDKVLPGFLSRGLSLPWQSDFDLCNTHWWPSARPDEVLPERIVVAEQTPERDADRDAFIAALPREKWARGLRDTPEDTKASFFPGSTDMIAYWNKLGFVVKELIRGLPIWVEKERTLGG